MWKCASRTVRATLKRSVRSSTVLSTKVAQNKDLHCLLKFAPALIEHCNRFYNFYKGNCENFSKDKKGREGPKEKKTSFLGGFDNNIFDALKWSGAFVLGYYLLQPFGCKRKFCKTDVRSGQNFSNKSACHETFSNVINALRIKPYNCVIPEVQAAKTLLNSTKKQVTKPTESETNVDNDRFIGLEKAHQKVLGTLSNWLGTQSMHSGRYKEALEYFLQSADEENAAGIYNLGICHERGLGTTQNLDRAAEFYERAAELGHATAMYNLGVFYARGIGGMELDVEHARELFTAAAKLGQRDAVKALNIEKQGEMPESFLVSQSKKPEGTLDEFIYVSSLNQSASNSPEEIDISDDVRNSFFKYLEGKETSFGSDSGVLDLSPHNEPSVLFV